MLPYSWTGPTPSCRTKALHYQRWWSSTATANFALIALLCVIARAFYSGNKWREVVGDAIFCPLIAFLLGNRLPELVIQGFTVTIIAAAVGTSGMHAVKLMASRATGVNLIGDKMNG
ncbi:hypothetical protein JD793_004321 [Citrobacter braakii]|nr:hypothetical protein [Citrobacter braakii]